MGSLEGIIHPRMLDRLIPTFFLSRADITYYSTETPDAYGQPSPAWNNFGTHINLPCSVASAIAREAKRGDMTIQVDEFTISLAGCYPTIQPEMRATVDGVTYDILGVAIDSHSKMTRLTCRMVNP